MNVALVLVVAVGAAVLVVVLFVVLAVVLSGRRRLGAELAAARADVDDLRSRVDGLTTAAGSPGAPAGDRHPEFVITSLTDQPAAEEQPSDALAVPQPAPVHLTAGQFATVALGESLVRVLSLGYGVRRALSAENRNRIRFEIRREVRRSRRQRRRDLKEAKRLLRTDQRSHVRQDAA